MEKKLNFKVCGLPAKYFIPFFIIVMATVYLGFMPVVKIYSNDAGKYMDSMIYEIGKTAGSMAAVLHGKVDGIVLTGGISHDKYVVEKLTEMLSFIAPITVMAGEFEMEALAAGAIRVLSGEEEAKTYTGIPVWSGFTC